MTETTALTDRGRRRRMGEQRLGAQTSSMLGALAGLPGVSFGRGGRSLGIVADYGRACGCFRGCRRVRVPELPRVTWSYVAATHRADECVVEAGFAPRRRRDRGAARYLGGYGHIQHFQLDEELRLRLGRRFGSAIDAWFEALPAVLSDLAERWDIEYGTVIQRGSVSVVIRCRTPDGGPAVLKASPARERVAHEAAALAGWKTPHVPAVLAVDGRPAGALLLEAVEPGNGARRIGCLPRARPPRRPHAGERSRRWRRARPRCNRPRTLPRRPGVRPGPSRLLPRGRCRDDRRAGRGAGAGDRGRCRPPPGDGASPSQAWSPSRRPRSPTVWTTSSRPSWRSLRASATGSRRAARGPGGRPARGPAPR